MTMRKSTLILGTALSALMASAALAATPAPYKPPRTADGKPDLQGNWNNSSMTPMARQTRYGNRLVMTPEEVAKVEGDEAAYLTKQNLPTDPNLHTNDLPEQCGRPADAGFNPGGANLSKAGCGYNTAWTDPGDKVMRVNGEPRTSYITSTVDGQVPATNAKAQARQAARRRPAGAPGGGGGADNPENRSLGDRCITSWAAHAGPVMSSSTYNNNYQFVQTKDTIAIVAEVVHDTRIVRMNAQHSPPEVKKYFGDSIGRWEGDTLVVETTNYHPNTNFRGANPDTLKVTERFKLVGPERMLYQFKVEDPETWDTAWGGEYEFKRGGQLYEVACHEGNYAMGNILAGARAEEAAAARAAGGAAPAGTQ